MQLEEQDIAATLKKYGKYTVYVHLRTARHAPSRVRCRLITVLDSGRLRIGVFPDG